MGISLDWLKIYRLKRHAQMRFFPSRTLPRNRFYADHSQADAIDIGKTKSKQASNYQFEKTARDIAQRLEFVDGSMAQAYGYQIGIGKVRIKPIQYTRYSEHEFTRFVKYSVFTFSSQ